jgi:hypothetical protein
MGYIGIYVHSYTVITQLKLGQISEILGKCWVEMMP